MQCWTNEKGKKKIKQKETMQAPPYFRTSPNDDPKNRYEPKREYMNNDL
jgi:hypothetical protein